MLRGTPVPHLDQEMIMRTYTHTTYTRAARRRRILAKLAAR